MLDHTPGPWVFDEDLQQILGANGEIIFDPALHANIRLILAAPDLLEACQHIHDWITMNLEQPVDVGSEIELQLRRAIAKAIPNVD